MEHFKQSLTLSATPPAVYAALTTPEGLRGWWSEDCEVDTKVGGKLFFRFGPNFKGMRIEKLEPGKLVQWQCTHARIDALTNKDEWLGTQLVFSINAIAGGGARLDFEHIGLVPALECYTLCEGGWQHFLASFRQYVEAGRGTPWIKDAAKEEWHQEQLKEVQGELAT